MATKKKDESPAVDQAAMDEAMAMEAEARGIELPVDEAPAGTAAEGEAAAAAETDAAALANQAVPDAEAAPAKPKRARRAAAKKDTPADPDPVEQPAEDFSESEPSPTPAARPPRRRRQTGERVVSIDAERSVETQADKRQNDLIDLYQSQKSRKILSGFIRGIEPLPDNPLSAYAVLAHGEFKVIIALPELVKLPAELNGRSEVEVLNYLANKRLGAEIDYIVQAIDPESGIAGASRLAAMAAQRRTKYYENDQNGEYVLKAGTICEARVVSVIRPGIFVEVFGVETYINMRELTYQRIQDASQHFEVGKRILVRLLDVNREGGRDNIIIAASAKQAAENPYKKALQQYRVGCRYVGEVAMVDTNGVFVALEGGIDCLCPYPRRGRPARGSRVTVRILGINEDAGRIWGAVTHMTVMS